MTNRRLNGPATAPILLITAAAALAGQQPAADPLVKENAAVKISDHVYVIPDGNVPLVPNVGIIVGSNATLVVDTGLGPRNGQVVLRETAKVSRNRDLFVVSTHFHPEHALGEPAFPATARIIRAEAQQKDIDEFGLALADTFSRRSPLTAELLKGVQFRHADISFSREYVVDLGGTRVRLISPGLPTHTRGDTVAFVEGDNVLFAGDVVMNRFLAFASATSSVRAWITVLDQLAALRPARIVPSHGEMGDASLIQKNRAYLTGLQVRVEALKKEGKTADEAAAIAVKEFQLKYSEWMNSGAVTAAAKAAYTETQ